MASGRFGRGNSAARTGPGDRRGRGLVAVELPRYVVPKKLSNGRTAFYFRIHKKYLDIGCPVTSEPLGTDYSAMCQRAEILNSLFDEWDDHRKGLPISGPAAPR